MQPIEEIYYNVVEKKGIPTTFAWHDREISIGDLSKKQQKDRAM